MRPVFADSDQYRFDAWATDDGLPQNSVFSILQTRDGYLWFTTGDGLVRHNGAQFTVFNKANSKGINSNRFSSIYEDLDGTLWAGTDDGGLTRYRDGSFHTYTTADGLPSDLVLQVRRTTEGVLLVSTSAGLAREQNGKFEAFSTNLNSFDFDIGHEGPSGAIWYRVGTELRRLKDGRLTSYRVPGGGQDRLAQNQIYEDRQGRLWIGTWGSGGIVMLKDEKLSHFKVGDGVPPFHVVAFCEDREGTMWFGTWGGGLVRYKDNRFVTFTTRDGLSSNVIRCVFEDREGTIWLGTDDAGIVRLTPKVITTYSEKDGMKGKIFYPIIEDRSGNIWIGNLGVNRLRDGRFTYYSLNTVPSPVQNLPYTTVRAFFEDDSGTLLIGHDWGIASFRDEKFSFENRVTERGLMYSIYKDRQGAFWAGYDGRLLRYKDGHETWYGPEHGLGPFVQPIFEDSAGRLWIGSYNGLAEMVDERLIFYTERDGLSSNRIRAIYETSDGVLWIGTYDGGLNRFKDGRFTSYTTKEGLFSNGVFAILEDEQGNFWMSSNQGIYRVSRRQLDDFAEGRISKIDSISYGRADGMLNTECNGARHPAAIKSRDGRMWFPTFEGVAVVDPRAVRFNPTPPPVVIEQVIIDREAINPRMPVEIKPGSGNLEIHYAGLSFIKPGHVRFRYKLEGLDEDWIEADGRRAAYYPHIPPGTYTFRVIAANSDGVWNNLGARIEINVLPPFWKTWWFAALITAIILGAMIAAYRSRIVKLERAQVLQQDVSRRLINSQETERRRIGAELHDSLGQSLIIIRNLSLMIRHRNDNQKEMDNRIDEITEEASRALGDVKEISYNLRPYNLDRLGLARALESLVDKISKACGIDFFADIDDVSGCFTKEEETSLYRIAQESLNNIVKHSGATRASLTLRRDTDHVELMLKDNGRGFDHNGEQANPQRSGFGLIGIAERARMLGGTQKIESEPERGTTVAVRITLKDRKDE
jgi:signal transduction histidine kinase/ligand-binding sensor domain-containing protein